MGERKERVISSALASLNFVGAGIEKVRLVVEASYFAPLYEGYVKAYLVGRDQHRIS